MAQQSLPLTGTPPAWSVTGGALDNSLLTLIESFDQYNGTVLTDHYHGGTSVFSVVDEANVTPTAVDGSQLLEVTEGWNTIFSAEGEGLSAYFSQGEKAICYVYADGPDDGSNSAFGFGFGIDGSDNGYMARATVEESGDDWSLKNYDGGTPIVATGTNDGTLPDQTQYRIEVDWGTDNTIDMRLFNDDTGDELRSLTPTDSTYTDTSGIAFSHDTGLADFNFYFDYIHKPQ